MGSSLSKGQEQLLIDRFKWILLMFDGDEAGRKVTEECLVMLGFRCWAEAVKLPDGKQPDQLSSEELQNLLDSILR